MPLLFKNDAAITNSFDKIQLLGILLIFLRLLAATTIPVLIVFQSPVTVTPKRRIPTLSRKATSNNFCAL